MVSVINSSTHNTSQLIQTDYPIILISCRILMVFILVVYFYLTHLLELDYIFLFYTNWGMLFALIYYGLVLASYRFSQLTPYAQQMLHTAWVMQCLITVVYWVIIHPIAVIYMPFYVTGPKHGLFLVMLTVDLKLSKVQLNRRDGIWSLVFTGFYMFGINMPYSLLVENIYPLLTFDTLLSWILTAVFCSALVGFNELAVYLTKEKTGIKLAKLK